MIKQSEKNLSGRRIGRLVLSPFAMKLGLALALTPLGFVSPAASETNPPSEALGADYAAVIVPESSDGGVAGTRSASQFKEPEGVLSLREALALSLLHNPGLAAFAWERRAREADALQAGLLANPVLNVQSENILGTGPFSHSDNAETTITLGQLVQLGGKRVKRRRVAELRRELADWDYEVGRIDVLTAVTQTFVSVLEAQSRLALAQELRRLADQSLDAVSKRVTAGAASRVEETRAAVNASSAQVSHRRAEAVLAAARARLAALWGSQSPSFEHAEGKLDTIYSPPAFEALAQRIESNPDIARWASELAHRQAVIDLQDARRIPNVNFQGSIRQFEAGNETAFVVGMTVPIPVFNRNQGARQAARSRRSRAFSRERAARAQSGRDLEIAYTMLRVGYDTVLALREDVLPQAEKAYDGVRTGYLRGLFRYVDVLDAQRTLFQLKGQELSGLGQFHRAAADVERLTGTPLETPSPDLDVDVEN